MSPSWVLVVALALFCLDLDTSAQTGPEKTQFEAAFQGRCGRESPCEQLCYELHDGMFECDCRDGYELHLNGYSCLMPSNNTSLDRDQVYEEQDDDDLDDGVLFQRGATFYAKLDKGNRSRIAVDVGRMKSMAQPTANMTYSVPSVKRQQQKQHLQEQQQQKQQQQQQQQQKQQATLPVTQPLPLSSVTTEPPKVRFVPTQVQERDQDNAVEDEDLQEEAADDAVSDGCTLDCGPGGACTTETTDSVPVQRCQCPLGRGGPNCAEDVAVRYPRFTGRGWLAFPALRAAYKRVSVHLEFRPEAWNGVLLLAGERDDMTGDFLAIVLHKGFVEFRFDCGSGVGTVRSDETVLLNQWNRLSLYRHRWDASIQLNSGKRVSGRSKGLFSRITFREPLFLGGPGNTTGLGGKLPSDRGLRGCVRHLEVNDVLYDFVEDAMQGFDVDECSADRCSKVPCRHGGKCVTASEDTAVCLCPLGYSGELCETRVDLLVPSFNGSSYLRYPGLGGSALTWLDLQLTLKPSVTDGLILYNGHRADGMGDFMALYMLDRYVEFTFDLGTGPATVRSASPLELGDWHEVRVSRTGRMAVMQVDRQPATQVLSPGAFLQLSLPLNLFLGGVSTFHVVSPKVRVRSSFVGCIQKVLVNERPLRLLASALAGLNVDNCPHPCAARPCGERGRCVPQRDYFSCLCPGAAPGLPEAPVAPDQECSLLDQGHPAVPGFAGDSYLHFTDADTIRRVVSDQLHINMRFRTTSSSGLLLWTGRHAEYQDPEVVAVHQRHGVSPSFGSDFLALAVQDGILHLRFDLGSGEVFLGYNDTRVDDGLWHRVNVVRRGQDATLSVDNGPAYGRSSPGRLRQLNANTGLFIGGVPDPELSTRGRYGSGIIGCVSDLILDRDFHVHLDHVAKDSVNVAACG